MSETQEKAGSSEAAATTGGTGVATVTDNLSDTEPKTSTSDTKLDAEANTGSQNNKTDDTTVDPATGSEPKHYETDVNTQTDFTDNKDHESESDTESDKYDTATHSGSSTKVDHTTDTGSTMGNAASQDEVLIDDAEEGAAGSQQPPGTIKQRPNVPRQTSRTSLNDHNSSARSTRSENTEDSVVTVTQNGFSAPEITIMEGQFVSFVWEDAKAKLDVVQVIHDSEKLRPVIGGYEAKAEDAKGQYDQQFNLEGEYKFAIHGIRCTPLTVNVKRRVDLLTDVTDNGFSQRIIYIDQGHSIKWQWKQCEEPHSIQEVKFCIDKKSFKKDSDSQANVVKTVTGSFRQTFQRPGLYFFQTESMDRNQSHLCVVHVREAQREYKMEILDRSFQPMILLIEEGDRVWWYWDKFKCKKPHSVYQIEAPPVDQEDDEPYEPVADGFRWTTPSKQGLMSHEFFKPGVYYFSDQNQQEAAEYIGTIIVKPKQKEHYIELTTKGFEQDIVNALTGDRIWFHWDKEAAKKNNKSFTIMETEKCLNPLIKPPPNDNDDYQYLDEQAVKLCTEVGLSTTNYHNIGVYHYRIADGPADMNTCSVIVNPGSKNHTIHLTDNGFEPKVITVRPNDRVWWVWQSGKKQHNIIQVSHQGSPIDGGFSSGMVRDPPSAYVYQFIEPGVFYFISSSLPKVFGAIVVSTQPQVHEVHVGLDIKPDPVTVKLNDIVCWIFRGLKVQDVTEVETVDQLTAGFTQQNTITPRRCLNRAITRTGLIHYCSKSFSLKKDSETGDMRETRFSSVVSDERYDNTVIRVDKDGFHPHFSYIIKGQSVLWTWKGKDDESHNIIHVTSADSKEPLNIIHGAKSFNSGKPVPNNSFLYTFDEPGSYTVASQGAPGYSCTIFVLRSGARVKVPFMKNNGGQVKRFTKIELFDESPGAKIFYTTDGSPPELHLDSAKLYKPEKGVTLRESGLCFVRAMAVLEGSINSHIFTSKRFWVLSEEGEHDRKSLASTSSEAEEKPGPSKEKQWDWWDCAPTIKACFTSPGVIEVFWDPAEKEQIALIKGYEIFLNGVTYCDMFPATNNSICVSGLAGGRLYEIWVEAYATKSGYDPQVSNKLMMKCPRQTKEGGPVISLERTDNKPDALAVVWMSIDTREYPISGYLVFLNDQQCGSRLVPDADSNRCKVVIGSCSLNQTHKVYVVALPRGEVDDGRRSNILDVTLPLDYEQVELPPEEERSDEPELYLEYLEVREGSGYLPAMDDNRGRVDTESYRDIKEGVKPLKKSSKLSSSSYTELLERQQHEQQIMGRHSPSPPTAYSRKASAHSRVDSRNWSADRRDSVSQLSRRSSALTIPHPISGRRQSVHYDIMEENEDHESVYTPQPPLGSKYSSPEPYMRQGSVAGIRRGSMISIVPEEEPRDGPMMNRSHKLSFKMMGTLAAAVQPPEVDMSVLKKKTHITFKMVASAVKNFITQENILRSGIAPGRYFMKFKFDWARFKTYVKSTNAFKEPDSATKTYQVRAPSKIQLVEGGFKGLMKQGPSHRESDPAEVSVEQDYDMPSRRMVEAHRRDPYFRQQSRSFDAASPERDRQVHYGQYLDVDRNNKLRGLMQQSRSFDGVSPDRIKHHYDGYRQSARSSRQMSREVSPNRRWPQGDRYGGRDQFDDGPLDTARTLRGSDYEHEHYMREQGFYDGEDTGYWGMEDQEGDSDYYDNPPTPPHGERYRGQYQDFRRKRFKYQSPRDSRYDRFQDSSPEDGPHSSRRPRGPNLEFYPLPKGQAPGALTMKEYNDIAKRQKKEFKHRKELAWTWGDKPMEDPRLKALEMYAPMLRNMALGEAIAVEQEETSSSSSSSDDETATTEEPTPREKKGKRGKKYFNDEGVDYAEYSKSDPRRQHSTPTQTDESEGNSSESESDSSEESSESEAESRSVATLPSQGSMAVISAKKPWEEQKRERSIKLEKDTLQTSGSVHKSAREVIVDKVKEDSVSGTKMEIRQHPRKPRMAIIEVQESVELDEAKLDGVEERRVAVSADKLETKRLVDEGEMVEKEDDGTLPAPSIMVETMKRSKIRVSWKLPKMIDSEYKLLLYVVNIVGPRFSPQLKSDHSFDCHLVEQGEQISGVQHCWNIQDDQDIVINGLLPGMTYRIFVIANYTTLQGSHPYAVQTTSSVIYYTTVGPPEPPKLHIVSVDLYQALLEWDPPNLHKDMMLKGYQLYVDGKRLPGALRPPDTRQVLIKDMIPGKTMHVKVVAVAKQGNIESEPSREIHITCPRRPSPPVITNQPSYKTGCVLVAWTKPDKHVYTAAEEEITLYDIYTDGKWYGKVKSNSMNNRDGYQFYLNNLSSEHSYEVGVKCIAGNKSVDPLANHVFCLSDSDVSNVLSVVAPSVPRSPNLRLEGLSPRGIEVTWQIPQEMGEVKLSGYQMLKNGQLYGGIIPPDSCNLCISDVMLGESVTLQLIALTEHPVGKMEQQIAERNATAGSSKDASPEVFMGDRYAGCRPGAKLQVHYSGLVLAPSSVWTEQVTGHSALIVWNKEDEPRKHYVCPDNYQVTWWPGEFAQDNINSDSTADDHLLITGLKSDTTYTVIVEARKMEKYKDKDPETPGREKENVFILTSKSDKITIKTAKPPGKPFNIGVSANTCHSLRVEWDTPRDRVEIIGIRVDAISLNTKDPHHISYDVMPDCKSVDVEGLKEKTEYLIRITTITDEYFDRLPDKHKYKKARTLPKDSMVPPQESPWLPNDYIIHRTAGTEPPSNVKVTRSSTTNMTLSWIPPIVYGSNKLKNIIVRWADVKNSKKGNDEVQMSSYKTLDSKDTATSITDLNPGTQYKVVVEAVVSIKTALVESHDKDMEKYRRTAHVMSKPVYARARAPTEAPKLYVTEYTQSSAQLYWEKPLLVSTIGKDADGKSKYLRRYLEGYKLEINGTTHCCLGPSRQSCSLKKCRPGKEYSIRLVALTCTDDGKKERKRKFKGFFAQQNQEELDYTALLDDEDNLDASPSEPIELVLPRVQPGNVESLKAVFVHTEDRDCRMFGNINVEWTIQGDTNMIKDFNVMYNIVDDDTVRQVRGASSSARQLPIPVERLKSVYQITVEPNYYTETLPLKSQPVQIVIPGPPDSPEIFAKSITPEEFVIEWGEPRLYGGVKVRGYQVYLNEKKAGNELSNSHRKAVIPCRPSRTYKISLAALSSNPEYEDSLKSNTLLINTSPHSPRQAQALEDWTNDDSDVPVKVAQVTDTSIHLDWSKYLEVEEVAGYKIEWSSVAQPVQRSLNLDRENNSCIINNCLPGTTHFVRLVAMDSQGKELERSRQLTVQTSAPPESPVLSIRACNFRYVAVQWEKPNTYGDALITGYKVFVNGIVQHTLNADQLSFTYTEGKWCHEYTFQVQAITAIEKLYSKVSEPLTIVWPGAQGPNLTRLPTHSSSVIRVGWDDVISTEGVKIKHFRGICAEEETDKVIYNFPIHPESKEVEFPDLKNKVYNIYLEVHLYGTSDVIRSEIMRVQPAPAPDPPKVSVTVVGLDERRQLNKITCDLVNKRDRLIRKVGHKLKEIGALSHPLRAEKNRDVIEGAHTLTRVEELLERCFTALDHYTGQLIAHVSWHCPQSRPEFQISGYKVLIDGKQYGSPMHEGVKTIRISLPVDSPKYRLSLVSMTDRPQATSGESNSIELLSENFRPFAFYCYHSIHCRDVKWPNQGCCKYQDSIMYERQLAKKLANQGLLKKRVPPPSCSLLDIFDGEYKPLLGTHNKQFPTAILFWTPWCLSSQNIVGNFVRFAKENASEHNFIAVTCGVNAVGANERKSLIHQITSNGWRADGIVWHCTSQCASSIYEATNNIWKNNIAGQVRKPDDNDNHKFVDLTEILGIAGVPTLLFIHPDGYIAWHGRYSAFDFASYSAFMQHTFSEISGSPCSVFKCDSCQNDVSIDDEAIEPVLQIVNDTPLRNLPPRLPSEIISTEPTSSGVDDEMMKRMFYQRKPSPKGKKKPKKTISVNHRPYSASTYVQLLKSPYMQQVVPSPKALNKLLRPSSASGAHLG